MLAWGKIRERELEKFEYYKKDKTNKGNRRMLAKGRVWDESDALFLQKKKDIYQQEACRRQLDKGINKGTYRPYLQYLPTSQSDPAIIDGTYDSLFNGQYTHVFTCNAQPLRDDFCTLIDRRRD